MIIESKFNDERERRVRSKDMVPTMDQDLHLDVAEVRSVTLPDASDGTRLLFIESSLSDLPDDVYSSAATLEAATVAIHTLTLVPGQPIVLPLDESIDEFEVTNNALSEGKVRIVVLQ